MSSNFPTLALRRTSLKPTLTTSPNTLLPTPYHHQQTRHATLLRRPKRPYTFTQLITLSDGSTFTHRTTSPAPIYRCTKDTRNHPLWNPSSQKFLNVEEDEAGRLRAFRQKFGRGWDSQSVDSGKGEVVRDGEEKVESEEDSLLDLISGYGLEKEKKKEKKKKEKDGGTK
ncbi:MAG: hypothetical protein M1812_000151 [Candelaria pacifica]|nr:MAG: hypothetical protein M1812_000151 [Candelaria pacifica]